MTKPSLEERVAQLQTAQRRQRDRWAEQGRCEDCGTDEDVTGAPTSTTSGTTAWRLSCHGCRMKRAGIEA
jgi:hypothetical protein